MVFSMAPVDVNAQQILEMSVLEDPDGDPQGGPQ